MENRGIVCMFCGDTLIYTGEKPTDELMEKAFEHEKKCPENPYLKELSAKDAEIERLTKEQDELEIVSHNSLQNAFNALSECSTKLSTALKENERLREALKKLDIDAFIIHLKRKVLDARDIKGHFCDAKAICESVFDSLDNFQKLRKQAIEGREKG